MLSLLQRIMSVCLSLVLMKFTGRISNPNHLLIKKKKKKKNQILKPPTLLPTGKWKFRKKIQNS